MPIGARQYRYQYGIQLMGLIGFFLLIMLVPSFSQTVPSTSSSTFSGTIQPNFSSLNSADLTDPYLPISNPPSAEPSEVGDPTMIDVPNYGKPRSSKDVSRRLPQKPAHPLPSLVSYKATDPRRFDPNAAATMPSPTSAKAPGIASPLRHKIDETPFEPTGIDIGSLRLKPYIEFDGGWDSNPGQTFERHKSSAFWRTEGGGKLESNWERHYFNVDLRGGYNDYVSDHSADRPDVQVSTIGRIDVTRDLTIDTGGRFILTSQRSSTPGVSEYLRSTTRPLNYDFGGDLGATQRFNRLLVALRGSADRYIYDDIQSASGQSVSQQENYNDYGLRGRIGYELTPAITPFVQASFDHRQHDDKISNGYKRDSDGVSGLVGSSFEITRLLTGEISAGYGNRSYADQRLHDANSPLLNASLIWTATPLTTVTLRGSTSAEETTVVGASAAVNKQIAIEISHALLRDVTIGGNFGYQNTNYRGSRDHEDTYNAGILAEYHLTRSIVVRANYRYQKLISNVPGDSYSSNVIMLGLRFQR